MATSVEVFASKITKNLQDLIDASEPWRQETFLEGFDTFKSEMFSEFLLRMSQKYVNVLLRREFRICKDAKSELNAKIDSLISKKNRLKDDQKNLKSQLGKEISLCDCEIFVCSQKNTTFFNLF